ncbi:hypothetical protein M407DRAFT_138640 [Tulasnella calospora MUT 4182]|uniref:Uncharacterized protein n=1 Tax=Tulasnella calospora MUT 4182 TaxID=1051891 RepID=A0A0C3QR48_9AGAM|nr:hypothetical protein M407DRAFT_138640 [Tulasnella calospora MUT 4182]
MEKIFEIYSAKVARRLGLLSEWRCCNDGKYLSIERASDSPVTYKMTLQVINQL